MKKQIRFLLQQRNKCKICKWNGVPFLARTWKCEGGEYENLHPILTENMPTFFYDSPWALFMARWKLTRFFLSAGVKNGDSVCCGQKKWQVLFKEKYNLLWMEKLILHMAGTVLSSNITNLPTHKTYPVTPYPVTPCSQSLCISSHNPLTLPRNRHAQNYRVILSYHKTLADHDSDLTLH